MRDIKTAVVTACVIALLSITWDVFFKDANAQGADSTEGRFRKITFVDEKGQVVAVLESANEEIKISRPGATGGVSLKFTEDTTTVDVTSALSASVSKATHTSIRPGGLTIEDSDGKMMTKIGLYEMGMYRILGKEAELEPSVTLENRNGHCGFFINGLSDRGGAALFAREDNTSKLFYPQFSISGPQDSDTDGFARFIVGWEPGNQELGLEIVNQQGKQLAKLPEKK